MHQHAPLRGIHSLVSSVEQPDTYFSGLRRDQGLSPDNVILFRRTNTSDFKPTMSAINFHHRYELVVLLEQEGLARIGEASYALHPGECALIFPHQFHHYMDVPPGNIEWLFITFECDNPKAIAALRDHPVTLDAKAIEIIQMMVQAYLGRSPTDPLSVSYHLAKLLLHLVDAPPIPKERQSQPSSDALRDVIIQKINSYVRQNLKNAPSLEELASKLGYSASHLRTVFREKLGITLGLYIRESRLAQAARLLLTTNYTVSKVARETGFTSLNAFSRAFTAYYHIPPKSYAQKFSTLSKKKQ